MAIVYLEDGSGSMAGERICFAKALGMHLDMLATKELCSFRALHFAGPGVYQEFNTCFSREYYNTFLAGGTDYTAPLTRCFAWFGGILGGKLAKHVIVLLTDGDAQIAPDALKRIQEKKEQTGAKILWLWLGEQYTSPLSDLIADKIIHFRSALGTIHNLNIVSEAVRKLMTEPPPTREQELEAALHGILVGYRTSLTHMAEAITAAETLILKNKPKDFLKG